MTRTTSNLFRSLAVALVSLGMAWSAHGSLIEIKFSTVTIPTTGANGLSPADPLKLALDRAGITVLPAPAIVGNFYYEGTTADTNLTTSVGNYNGALDRLSFTVGSWLSQSLTNIGLNGDIVVRNNTGTSPNVLDSVTVTLVCTTPVLCPGGQSAGQFAYSFLDPGLLSGTSDDVTWVLDQFVLTLTENPPAAGLPTHLSSDSLPTRAEWEALSTWTAETINLRFNPTGTAASELVQANISFLAVPEPGTLALFGLGLLLGVAGMRRKA